MTSAMQGFIQTAAELLINSLPAGLLIAFGAWALLRLVGRQNSGTRFAIWFSSLLMIASLPVLALAGSSSALPVSGSSMHHIALPSDMAWYVIAAWLLVAGTFLLRIGFGLWKVRALRKSCTPVQSAALNPELRQILATQNKRHAVLCSSEQARVPAAVGFLKPIVVVPEWALRDLSPQELNTVVLHELAHLDRWDDWTNLAQKVLRAVFFFHPAMWWIDNRLSLEREMACDDAVLAQTANPRQYAECLVSLAEKSFVRRSLAMAQAAIGRMSDTAARLAQILDRNRPSGVRLSKPVMASVGTLSLVTLLLAPHSPQLVAFQGPAQPAPQIASSEVNLPPQFVVPAMQHVRTAPAPVIHRTPAAVRPKPVAPTEVFAAQQDVPAPTMVNARMPVQPQGQTFFVIETTFQSSRDGSWSIQVVRMMLTLPVRSAQPVPAAKST